MKRKYLFQILLMFAIVLFFEPLMIDRMAAEGYSNMVLLHKIFSLGKYGVFAITAVYYLWHFKFNIKKVFSLYFLYTFFLAFSTMLNYGDLKTLVAISYPTITFIMIAELVIDKNFFNEFNKQMFWWLGLLTIINLYLMFKYPDGMYIDYRNWKLNWLFGNYQQNTMIFIPVIVSGLISINHYDPPKFKVFFGIVMMTILYTVYLTQSKTTLVMIFTIGVVYGYAILNKKLGIFSAKNIFIASIVFSVMIIVFKLQHLFDFIIEGLLHKNLTFNGRDTIWEVAKDAIKNKPVLGIGAQDSDYISNILTVTRRENRSAHNQYLSTLFTGGVVSSIIFYSMTIRSLRNINKEKYSKDAIIISLGLISFFIMFITEAWRDLMYYFMLITFGYYIQDIEKNKELDKII